jgi:hypothetical protein
MATTVHYRKGKGPFGNGDGLAVRYAKLQREMLKLANDPSNAAGKRESALLATAMKGMIERHGSVVQRLGDGFQARDVGPDVAQGVPILGNLSVAYSAGDMIGRELLPIAPVDLATGEYVKYVKRDRMQVVRGAGRGARGEANEVPRNEQSVPYQTVAHEHLGSERLDAVIAGRIAQRNAPVDRLTRMVDDVGYHHQLEQEAESITTVTTAGNYDSAHKLTLTSGTYWDSADAEIGKCIDEAKSKIWNGQGNTELVAWCSEPVWKVVRRNTALVGLLSASDRGFLTPEQFCEIFELDGLLVSDLRLDSANIAAAESAEFAWGNYFGLARVSRTPQQLNAALGYTMRWNASDVPQAGLMSSNQGVFTRMWFDPEKGPFGSFRYKMADYWGINLVAADTAFLFSTPLTPSKWTALQG